MILIQNIIDYSVVLSALITDGVVLTREAIFDIQRNYSQYLKRYPLPERWIIEANAATLKEEFSDE